MKLFSFTGVVLVGLTTLATGTPVIEGQGLEIADPGYSPASSIKHLHDGGIAEKCTPNLKMCAADGVTLLLCNESNQWDEFKKCPACCRYGTHGYPDCYTQCDPTRPPVARSTLDGLNTGNSHGTFNNVGKPSSKCSDACKQRKCCENQGGANEYCKCPDNIILVGETDIESGSDFDTGKRDISSLSDLEYTCKSGRRQCSPDGKTLQHCLGNGEWVDLHVCPTRCLENRKKSAYCAKHEVSDLDSRQAHSYGLCRRDEEGKKQCGSQWWIVICKNGQWVNWELCSRGFQCDTQSEKEPKCGVLDVLPRQDKDRKLGCRTPGRQTCANEGRTIVICNNSHEWKKVGDCLGGKNCCRANKQAGTAVCLC